jgi:alkanesulfonate monooxygenase SsuD/methylene tetrahydromethanopterin reductase-like flavin-dependent oxidoreductase (luciferase family)
MRLGLGLPFQQPDGSASTLAHVKARAQLIERIGFDGIWFGDSIGRVRTPRPDTLLWLAIAAAATDHIEVGSAVLQVPLRHPVELAKRLFTMHGLTGGRFTAGLGAGSTRTDFDAVARHRMLGHRDNRAPRRPCARSFVSPIPNLRSA